MTEFLLELLSEEIPARMQAKACEDLGKMLAAGLKEAGLAADAPQVYATPRRLAAHIPQIADATEAAREEFKGPRVDAPPKALEGFLRKTGVAKEALERRADKKGEVFFAVVERPARAAENVIAEMVPDIVRRFPWPKSMRWGAGDLRWVRPLRGILCILSDGRSARTPQFDVDGLAAGAVTYGHRFLAPQPIAVRSFAEYRDRLAEAFVTLDPAARRAAIEEGARRLAKAAKLELVDDAGLLTEVAGLVEHPVPLSGAIDKAFQALPPEVLQTSMREHQKFFALREAKTGKITRFVTVANITAEDGGAKIVAGNERVLRARLADARFFYDNDLASPLQNRLETLEKVTFHNQLGSQADQIRRMRALAESLAPLLGAEPDQAGRAAQLAKADLATEMVYEFPELQGLMGRYYAAAAGEPAEICEAIEAHYAPKGPTDAAPKAPVAMAVALADKLDQLAAFWAIGAKPTGSGDPFALRRAALGVIRIVLENGLRLRLARALKDHAPRLNPDVAAVARRGETVVAEAPAKELDRLRAEMTAEGFVAESAERLIIERRLFDQTTQADLLSFILERLKVFLRGEGVRHDVIDAVYNLGRAAGRPLDDLVDLRARIDALSGLIASEDGANLLAAYKRANNILEAEQAKDGAAYDQKPDAAKAAEPEEAGLFAALEEADAQIGPAMKEEDFSGAMAAMARLRRPLDAFFDKVIVNAEDQDLRANRLRLLSQIRRTMGQVADFGAIEG